MAAVQTEVSRFSGQLRAFAEDTRTNLDLLRRNVQQKPCVGPSAFRASLQDISNQEAGLHKELTTLTDSLHSTPSMQSLLTQCLSAYNSNQERLATMERHLEQYGYSQQYSMPAPQDPFSQLPQPAPAGLTPNSAQQALPPSTAYTNFQAAINPARPASAGPALPTMQQPASSNERTPSPPGKASLSSISLTPAMRELRLKYEANSEVSELSDRHRESMGTSQASRPLHNRSSLGPVSGSMPLSGPLSVDVAAYQPPPGPLPFDAAVTGSAAAFLRSPVGKKQLGYLALEGEAPIPAFHRHTEAPRPAPLASAASLPSAMDSLLANTALPPGALRTGEASSLRGSNESLEARMHAEDKLGAGDAPWDMISLKAALNKACPGTGEVELAIASATFHPQAAAFTALLKMCAKDRQWEKALEVFAAMKKHHPGVTPNTVHFSSAISACGTAGRWREAEQVWREMVTRSRSDPQCRPNVISYSALMTVYCQAGQLDKAEDAFQHMKLQGVTPDHICYSTLIAGFEKFNQVERARRYHDEMMQAGLVPRVSALTAAPLAMAPLSQAAGTPHPLFKARPGLPPSGMYQGLDAMGMPVALEHDTIPAHFGRMAAPAGMQGQTYGGPAMDDPTLELRRHMLRTRSPHLAAPAPMPDLRTPVAACTPHYAQAGLPPFVPMGQPSSLLHGTPAPAPQPLFAGEAPSTDELLRAAHGGSYYHPGAMRGLEQQSPALRGYLPRAHVMHGAGSQQELHAQLERQALLSQRSAPNAMLSQLAAQAPYPGAPERHFSSSWLPAQASAAPGVPETGPTPMHQQSQFPHTPQAGLHQPTGPPLTPAWGLEPSVQPSSGYQAEAGLPASSAFGPIGTNLPPPQSIGSLSRKSSVEAMAPAPPQAASAIPDAALAVNEQEYKQLPARFTKQLPLDTLNHALAAFATIIAAKAGTDSAATGVTVEDLAPLQLGPARTTALINALLHLQRLRLCITQGGRSYVLAPPA